MKDSEQQILSDAANALLRPGNSIAVTMRIDREVFGVAMKLPETTDLTTDDNVGDIGYAISKNVEAMQRHMIVEFNKLVKEKQNGN